MELVKYPAPILKKRAVAVVTFNRKLARIADEMLELMYRHNGLGLAAPQAGMSSKIIVANPSGLEKDEIVLVNPQIAEFAGESSHEEGCLSFPGIFARIERPRRVLCAAKALSGRDLVVDCDGLLARILQHEIDHLDGVLLVDRMNTAQRKTCEPDLRRLRKEYRNRDACP
jgi:peptide deformylase